MKLKSILAVALCAVGLAAFAEPEAVQLWADGPYFATCNVGATKPEEYGYYFWWGDTVGYTNNGLSNAAAKWVSVVDGTTTIQFSGSDPTATNTYNKTNDMLKQEGWIDDSGNLVVSDSATANRDAARAHLGAPWRMMTKGELDKLVNADVCQWEWVTVYKGVAVNGLVVKGKAGSAYANNEVFLPAAGWGSVSRLLYAGSNSYSWSSTPYPERDLFEKAWNIVCFGTNVLEVRGNTRYNGVPVRAVRDTPPEAAPAASSPISAKSKAGTVDLRTAVALAVGETTVSNVTWSATQWGKVPEMFTTVGWTNLSTGATGVFGNLSNIMGEGAKDAVLPQKDGDYVLTHSRGDLKSFATFTVSGTGNPVGSKSNPWLAGKTADDSVVAYTNGVGGVVVEGEGDMKDFTADDAPWGKAITSAEIGGNVTGIGTNAFTGCASLTNVTVLAVVPPSMDGGAFAGCDGLATINVPRGTVEAYKTAPGWSEYVAMIVEPGSKENPWKVGDGVTAYIDESGTLHVDGEGAMSDFSDDFPAPWSTAGIPVTSAEIGEGVTGIGTNAFKNCSSLTNVTALATVPPSLGGGAFSGCDSLAKIYVPWNAGDDYRAVSDWSEYAAKILEMPGSAENPWTVGPADVPDGVVAWTDGNGSVYFKPPRGAVSRTGLETVTNAMGGASFPVWLVSADRSATNDLVMVIGASGARYDSIAEALEAGEGSYTLYDVDGCIVNYDGMGAMGEMPSETFLPGISTNLTANAFTAFGYEFQGWTTNFGSEVIFADRALIANPKAGDVYDLQAVWKNAPVPVGDGVGAYLDMHGALHIVGAGAMKDFTEDDPAPWAQYAAQVKSVEIGGGVTKVGNAAFAALDYKTTTETFVVLDGAHELNTFAFVSADGTVTNAPAIKAFRVFNPESGAEEPIEAFYSEATETFYDSVSGALSAGEDALRLVTLEDVKDIFRERLTEAAGEKPYSKAMQELLGQAFKELDAAKTLADAAGVADKYAAPIQKQATLDKVKGEVESEIAKEAGPQPWTENVEAAVTEAVRKIDEATTEEAVRNAGADGIAAVRAAKAADEKDPDFGGTIPGSDVTWKLAGGQMILDGTGEMPDLTAATAPWGKSISTITTVVVGDGVTGLSEGLFTSGLTAPATTVLFESAETWVPLEAFVSADGTETNGTAEVLFGTDAGGTYSAPYAWIGEGGDLYESYAEALAAGEQAVKPSFAAPSDTVEEQIEKVPAVIVEDVSAFDEKTGRFTTDPEGNLIAVVATVENVNTNGVETSERIAVRGVAGLAEAARLEAAESVGVSVLSLTVDAVRTNSADEVQQDLVGEMTNGLDTVGGFIAKFAEITLATNGMPIAEAKAVIEIRIPYVTAGRENFSVARIHDGQVDKFVQIDAPAEMPADGTFLVGDGEIVIWTMRFSLYAIGSTGTVEVVLPTPVPGITFVVSNLTEGVEIPATSTTAGGAVYMLPIGARVAVMAVTSDGRILTLDSGEEARLIIDPVSDDVTVVQAQLNAALTGWGIVAARLYPAGDGAFKPAVKTTTYYGTLVDTNGVEGTITLKMAKPNKKGQFNLSATVKTLVDKQSYSFKAKKVTAADGVAADDGALTFVLEGSNKKAKAHALAVTLGGDSLTGAFDEFLIDGARHVFSTRGDPKREAVLPLVGTWTGAFAETTDTNDVSMTAFSAKLSKNGSAKVKVIFSDGKTASCSAKAEVGADIVAVPVTLWRSVKGDKRSLGFRLVFAVDADGNAVCEAANLAPIRDWTKKTDETVVVEELRFLAAGLQTVTAKEFKSYVVTVDPVLEAQVGPVTKSTLRLTASTGLISGSLKWKVTYVDARGREKTKTVTGKATGVVVNGIGIGTVTVKLGRVTESFAFTAAPPGPDTPPAPVPIVIPVP